MGFNDFIKKSIVVKDGKTAPQKPRERETASRRLRTFNPAVDGYREENAQRLEMCYPKTMADAKKIADMMMLGEAALVDVSCAINESEAQTMLDFFCGAAYVLGGEATQVRENVFLITVRGVEIMVED